MSERRPFARRLVWALAAGVCRAVSTFRGSAPMHHTDGHPESCEACQWREPWDRWERLAWRRAQGLSDE